ncbi:MAG TPA: hypothetical protein PKA10_00510 [Selenomonadales bacterium]|nr:hypothetical protein [Selenomonadales bacterium]
MATVIMTGIGAAALVSAVYGVWRAINSPDAAARCRKKYRAAARSGRIGRFSDGMH